MMLENTREVLRKVISCGMGKQTWISSLIPGAVIIMIIMLHVLSIDCSFFILKRIIEWSTAISVACECRYVHTSCFREKVLHLNRDVYAL